MNAFIYFSCICALIYFGITWALSKFIGWILLKKFNTKVRFGRISLPFSLKDVNICKNGFYVQIDEICIRSSFFNSEVTKLLSINIKDIRINKDINKQIDVKKKKKIVKKEFIDFRNKKVPPSIIKFAQFMAVHIHNISVVLMSNNFEPGWVLHATASELHLDGSIVHNAKTLLVTAALNDAQAKILRQSPNKKTTTSIADKQYKNRPCLAELSFAISMDCILIAQGPLSLEKMQLTMNNTKIILHGGLYDFIRDIKKGYGIKPETDLGKINDLHRLKECDTENDDAFQRLSPILPKNFLVKIEDTIISAVRENNSNDFSSKLQLLMVNGKFGTKPPNDEYKFPILHTGFQLQLLEIDTKYEKLLYVEQYTMETKLERDTLHIYSKLKTFQLIYNHQEVFTWIQNNFLSYKNINHSTKSSLNLIKKEANFKLTKNKESLLESILKSLIIKGCAELWNVSTHFKLDEQNASFCCSHTKFLLEQYNDVRSGIYKNKISNFLFANRHWSAELMIESFWWALGASSRDSNSLKKYHTRGSPFFLGVSLIKLSSYGSSTKFDLSIHTLRTEYSAKLASFIIQSIKCINQYKFINKNDCNNITETEPQKLITNKNKFDISDILINAKITDIKFYFFNKFETCILVSLSEMSLARTQPITAIKLNTLQMAILATSNSTHMSLSDFNDIFANIKLIRIEILKTIKTLQNDESSQITIYVNDDNEAMWNTNLHMHLVTLFREITELKHMIAPVNNVNADLTPKTMSKKNTLFDLYAENNTVFTIKFSERHSMQILFGNVYLNKTEKSLISVENIFIYIDGQNIFSFNNIDIQSVSELTRLTNEREQFKFSVPSNKVWITIIGGFKVIFPYNHDFSEAIQNELVSLYKWLKLIHNYKKKEFTQCSPLPSDMLIQIKEFLFEMSDDPFEVKLRDNYILLLDEYNESLKRQNIFDQKIKDLCSDRLSFSASTIKELYASLVKKNSEIYIQRSKKINEAGPRTRLFAWIMTDLSIMAMADPTIHGTENVTRTMQEIDQDSPWPEEGLQFVTLWCRGVDVSCSEWKFMLRDYPQPMFSVKSMHLFGTLCGAEQLAPRRAKREVQIEIGEPFDNNMIERGMTSLKFYHDFDCELGKCSYAFGPCWEPVMAQCNLSFEKISAPSRDPSPTLPFWDKLRLLFHGTLTMIVKEFTVLLHASLNPYNTTEEMELTWNDCNIFWTNARIVFKGDLNVTVRTASRYDDCRMLHFPNLKLTIKLNWICLANPNDHHAVIPCAPDKLPEYSSNQVHDSFRAFRSQNVNIWISFETKQLQHPFINDIPSLDLYGSTLRWFESLKLILSGVTRPTRRGPVFNNVRPRKKQLSRHYKKARLQMSLHRFQVSYWISHSRNRGFELLGNRVSFSSEHNLTLIPINDGLIHRPRADWSTIYMNCELSDTEIWLKSNEKSDSSTENISDAEISFFAKYYFLSVAKVSYGREALLPKSENESRQKDTPTHKLVVYDLKGAWTKNNRDVAFALFDSFMKAQKLKSNLSTEALKGFCKDGTTTPLKSSRSRSHDAPTPSTTTAQILSTTTTNTQQQINHAATMLQQLIAEADHKSVVFSDDLSAQTREQQLQGLQACQDDDVTHYNWFISLVNSQVLLRGCETSGYVILSAAKAEILQRVHRPVWRDRSLVPKTTWIGSLECMQYYATVSGNQMETQIEEIMWLTVDNIQEKDKDSTVINELPDLPHLVGSGGSVGGVVSQTVGASGAAISQAVELQRIVSRCKCEFFYVSYGDTTIDPSTLTEVPAPPTEDIVSPWEKQDDPVDAFTLMHHDLDVCTNSTQYAMILDIVNNLLLYVEPQRKQALEKLTRMKFQLQLYSSEDQKRPIQHLQTMIRSSMSKLRGLEKDIYLIEKARMEEGDSDELVILYDDVKGQIRKYKETLNTESEELDMMLSCYKDTQLSQLNKLQTVRKDKPITIVRANEICFKHAQWRLTESDGQIGIADLILSNFLYTKKSKSDDSVEHLLELGYIRMNNLTQEIYKEVLSPTEIQRDMPVDHKRVLRVFCREKSPVGGISVKEHFEINVVPITIAITKRFYNTMLKFCFPDRVANESNVEDIDETGSTSSLRSNKKTTKKEKKPSKDSEFYVKIEKDDVEKMKERAEKNKLFIYIKIPEVPVRVSYKGNKEKNIEDITDFSLVIPTLEYHNVTWTWLDLLLAMKSDSRRVILSQAIKQKLQIHRHKPLSTVGEKASPQEEDKAKMLFGNRHGVENRSQKRGILKLTKQ